jgi:hypothetical protein
MRDNDAFRLIDPEEAVLIGSFMLGLVAIAFVVEEKPAKPERPKEPERAHQVRDHDRAVRRGRALGATAKATGVRSGRDRSATPHPEQSHRGGAMNEDFDILEYAKQIAEQHRRLIQSGQEIERERMLPLFKAIFNEFDLAARDANAKMPQRLQLAIIAAKNAIGEIRAAGRIAKHEYQERRDGGTDMTTHGMPLRPGS